MSRAENPTSTNASCRDATGAMPADPIDVAITRHSKAEAALDAALAANAPEHFDRLTGAAVDALCALVDTRPTTIAGAAEMAHYLAAHLDTGVMPDGRWPTQPGGKDHGFLFHMLTSLARCLDGQAMEGGPRG